MLNFKNKTNSRPHSDRKVNLLKCKRSQQEAVGFVIIILIVMILGVIFIGVWLRANSQGGVFVESAEISNFLSASLSYTTECYKDNAYDFKSLGDIIFYCYNNQAVSCPEAQNSCAYANKTLGNMLERFKPAGVLSYYGISANYKIFKNNSDSETTDETQETSMSAPFIRLSKGDISKCITKIGGQSYISAGEGDIVITLETCRENEI